jgi:hypothetical protein
MDAGSSALSGTRTNLLLARLSGARTVSRSRSLSRRQSDRGSAIPGCSSSPRLRHNQSNKPAGTTERPESKKRNCGLGRTGFGHLGLGAVIVLHPFSDVGEAGPVGDLLAKIVARSEQFTGKRQSI